MAGTAMSQRWIVTGGSRGVGLAVARLALAQGDRVAVVARNGDSDALQTELGARALAFRGDVTDPGEMARIAKSVAQAWGGIDVLVNNAAVLRDQALVSKLGKKMRKHSLHDWHETIRSNLTGPFLMSREVAHLMLKTRTRGLIVNVSSVSRAGNPGQTSYAAAKSGLDALTVTWAKELAPYGIRVAAIAPGFVETSMTKGIPPLFLERLREATPLKRYGTLEEFQQALMFVLENDYFNGRTLELDGGLRF